MTLWTIPVMLAAIAYIIALGLKQWYAAFMAVLFATAFAFLGALDLSSLVYAVAAAPLVIWYFLEVWPKRNQKDEPENSPAQESLPGAASCFCPSCRLLGGNA